MATSEENKELIETIKRPVRHYRIMLWGYGGENSYTSYQRAVRVLESA